MFRLFSNAVDPFHPHQVGTPSADVWPFLVREFRPLRAVVAASLALTIVTAGIEVWLIGYSGELVDTLATTSPARFWDRQADGFIVQLRDPQGRTGYEAHVGERGVMLSGGQRQRIALARAICKEAPILVLDEATSALDSEAEAAVHDTLDQVMEDRTVIAIAHRLSTIARMDRIAVLDEGRIVEEGTHQDLLARGGLYAALWARQSGGFLGADPGPARSVMSAAPVPEGRGEPAGPGTERRN